jgi:hypothetical protein
MAFGVLVGGAVLLVRHAICLAVADGAPPAAASATTADDKSNPYSVIIDRNVFRLNPPPPAAQPSQEPPPNLPALTLSGFIQIGDKWNVLLAVKSQNPDPKAAPLQSFLTLAEGDKEAVTQLDKQVWVELVKVYADQEKVDLVNAGTPMTLSLRDNGFASPPPSPSPPTAPAMRRNVTSTPTVPHRDEAPKVVIQPVIQHVRPASAAVGVSGADATGVPSLDGVPLDGGTSTSGGTLIGGSVQ